MKNTKCKKHDYSFLMSVGENCRKGAKGDINNKGWRNVTILKCSHCGNKIKQV